MLFSGMRQCPHTCGVLISTSTMCRSALQTFDHELELRKSQLEETIEMGAALSNESNESSKFAIDDEISKLKEHWESVLLKFQMQRKLLQDISEDWGVYEDHKRQLIKWIQTADGYYSEVGSKEPGSTVTELEEQLVKHKVGLYVSLLRFEFGSG